jgi:photosystem II stability/assembly factor-like uncharacterized protein
MRQFFIIISILLTVSCSEKKEYILDYNAENWLGYMRDGANYLEAKEKFLNYYDSTNIEESPPKAFGHSWLGDKFFYLDTNGIVQQKPFINPEDVETTVIESFEESTTRKSGTWDLLGPVNGKWNYSGVGGGGGYVHLVKFDPTNTDKIFLNFYYGGLWVTENGGVSWTLVGQNMGDYLFYDINVSLSDPDIVYGITEIGLWKSTDGGLNWDITAMNYQNVGTSKTIDIAVSPTDSDLVVVRWSSNLWRTTDGGYSWNAVNNSNLEVNTMSYWTSSNLEDMLEWDTKNENDVYFANPGRNSNYVDIYKSEDAGLTFNNIKRITLASNAYGSMVGWAKIFLPTSNSESFYVATGSGNSVYAHKAAHLYKLKKSTGEIELERINMMDGQGSAYQHQGELHHGDLAMDLNDENLIIWGGYGNRKNYYSTNNGESYSLSPVIQHYDIRSIDVVDGIVAIGNDGQLVISKDGGVTNFEVSNSISNNEIWGFGSAFKSDIVAVGLNHGPSAIKENYNGYEWYHGNGADQGNTEVNILDDRWIYSYGYQSYRYFRTGPHSFTNDNNNPYSLGLTYYRNIEFHPNLYYTFFSHHNGRYPNNGPNNSTWKRSLMRFDDNGKTPSIVKTFSDDVLRVKIPRKNSNYIYVVEGLSSSNRLWVSKDGGSSWSNITPYCPQSNTITDIAVNDENPDQIWVTFGGVQSSCKILLSSNSGSSWSNLSSATLTTSPITKIIYQRGSNGGIYVANYWGVYYKNNNMSDWEVLGEGLPYTNIRFMFINYNLGKLRIGTKRGGFEHDLYEVSPPDALFSVDKNKVVCSTSDLINFKDYSVIRNESATWQWKFEGGLPRTSTEENPIVSYTSAKNGFYDVELTVKDNYGTSTYKLENFIEVANTCPIPDTDGDGVIDTEDNCPLTPNSDQSDLDSDGVGDVCEVSNDPDTDGDGVSDDKDQCPDTPQGESVDANGCSASQKDTDGDGVSDDNDQCPDTPQGESVDANGCSASQKDTDGDGVSDDKDQCPDTSQGESVDANGCSASQKDTDGDGIFDDIDNCPLIANSDQADWNNNGVGDVCGDPKPLFTENVTFVENIYPNPADDKLFVKIKPGLMVKDLYFNDISGNQIKPRSFLLNKDMLNINVSNLIKGVYILEIVSDKEVDKVKVVIER